MNPSIRNLLLSNALTLAAALALHWDIGWMLWSYWVQSVIIGWYARKRMLTLDRFSTKGFTSSGRPVPEDESGKRSTAFFFCIHYGFFHFIYMVFLIGMQRVHSLPDVVVLAGCGASFAFSQRHTWKAQHAADLRGRPNLGALMFLPYLRVVPMHLSVMAGAHASTPAAVVFFSALKTASDVLLDFADRRIAIRAADDAQAADAG